jgi:hypothetical protein
MAAPAIGAITSPTSIQSCIDRFASHPYFASQLADHDVVKDNVLLVLGVWTLMYRYYLPGRCGNRHILQAYCNQKKEAYDERIALQVDISTLVSECGLLPHEAENQSEESNTHVSAPSVPNNSATLPPFTLHESFGLVESLSVEARTLNAFKLTTLAGIRIRWTDNISRHLLLSKHAQKFYLDLFSLPCALQGERKSVLHKIQPFETLGPEILRSYSILFSPEKPSFLHRYLGMFVGLNFWCWCLCCSSNRLCQRELRKLRDSCTTETLYDDALSSDAGSWTQRDFKRLWPRILALDSHLQNAKPWTFWVIFRDRRDTLQFWTFW